MRSGPLMARQPPVLPPQCSHIDLLSSLHTNPSFHHRAFGQMIPSVQKTLHSHFWLLLHWVQVTPTSFLIEPSLGFLSLSAKWSHSTYPSLLYVSSCSSVMVEFVSISAAWGLWLCQISCIFMSLKPKAELGHRHTIMSTEQMNKKEASISIT